MKVGLGTTWQVSRPTKRRLRLAFSAADLASNNLRVAQFSAANLPCPVMSTDLTAD